MTPVLVPIILLIAAINSEIEYGIISSSISRTWKLCIILNDYAFQTYFFMVNASNKYKSFFETQLSI